MSTISQILEANARVLKRALAERLTNVPSTTCPCGKPIVFPHPKKTFKCTRCGRKWQLVVTVQPIKG